MKPSPNAELVLKTRYYKENEDWDALCKRVSQFISQPNPELESEYFNLLNEFWFLPNSPTLMNAGTEIGNTAACFVLDVSDSMDSIMETAKDMATIFRAGGGVGVDMSKLRENGSKVKKTQGVASGSVSFMEIYDTVARVTKQGGVRRAALMGVLRVDHPEILDFITVKNNRTALNNFNLSVGITQEFMEALKNNDTYDVISPITGKVDEYKAKDIFEFIAMNAHKHGEPGLLFLDTINNRNPIPQFGKISATNPCLTGETLVAVADGRNFVSIKELAESGDDVLVYTMDYNGNPVPSMMRHPRLTGYNQPIYKITLDDGSIVRATRNHKFKMIGGHYVEVANLKKHDMMFATKINFNTQQIDGSAYIHYDKNNFIEKQCEHCGHTMIIFDHNERECSYCSQYCGSIGKLKNELKLSDVSGKNEHIVRVISVEPDGFEDVYNGTIDSYHNFYVAFPENKDDNMSNLLCINNLQCGEQPLLANSACVLGSINLSKISNIDELDKLVRLSVRFLNNSIDVSEYPLDKINQTVRQLRQIGLGVMGWADYLAQRDIPYDSSRAIIEANAIMSRIKAVAHDESVMIAIERNVYIDTIEGKRYNGGLLSIAPTGTISMLADCSSSIEPYFALAYQKNVLDGESLTYINDILKEKLIYYGLWSPEVEQKIIETGSVQDIDEIPENIKQVFKTANDISVEAHIKMQAAFQIHVDSGISKTINMSNDADVDDVKRAYLLAYQLGCKGITVYRDGSRQGQVLTTNATKSETCPECSQETVLESGCRSCKHCGWSACSTS